MTEKKMFRESVLTRRCLVPANGFYEWKKEGKRKTKRFFQQPGSNVMYMAGLYNQFKGADGPEERFVILTTQANDSMLDNGVELSLFPTDERDRKLIHDRISVILQLNERQAWLANDVDFVKLFDRDSIELRCTTA